MRSIFVIVLALIILIPVQLQATVTGTVFTNAYIKVDSGEEFIHCVFYNCKVTFNADSSLKYCILYNESETDLTIASGITVTGLNNWIEDIYGTWGDGNYSDDGLTTVWDADDPMFKSPSGGDFRLNATSPVVKEFNVPPGAAPTKNPFVNIDINGNIVFLP